MNKYTYLGLAGLVTTFFTMPATATIMMNDALQDDLNNITKPTTPPTPINTTTDQVFPSSHWVMDSSGGSENRVVFQATSNNGYSFGIYDPNNINTTLQIFSADATSENSAVSLTENGNEFSVNNGVPVPFTNDPTDQFGYYISGSNGTFYSDPTLNGGDLQMVTLQGNNKTYLKIGNNPYAKFSSGEFILGWNTQGPGNTPNSNYTTGGSI